MIQKFISDIFVDQAFQGLAYLFLVLGFLVTAATVIAFVAFIIKKFWNWLNT